MAAIAYPRRLVCLLLLPCWAAAAAAHSPGSPSFDTWAEHLASDWVRANPMFATASQYFSGDEQDALDRRLTAVDG